jgi:hypothetical protein
MSKNEASENNTESNHLPVDDDNSNVPYIREIDSKTQSLFRAALARSKKCTNVVEDLTED